MTRKITLILNLLLILLLYSCKDRISDHENSNIQGEWVLMNQLGRILDDQLYISFKDSTCNYFSSARTVSNYKVSNDTILIQQNTISEGKEITELRKEFRFTIKGINEDKLTLIPIDENSDGLFNSMYFDSDSTFVFKPMDAKNDFELLKIGIYTDYCFGKCPSMFIEIDESGGILFNGIGYTEKKGFHSGELSLSQMKSLKNWVNAVDLVNLEESYNASYTDAQTKTLTIVTSNGTFKTSVYGNDQGPFELKLLINELMAIYKNIDLEAEVIGLD